MQRRQHAAEASCFCTTSAKTLITVVVLVITVRAEINLKSASLNSMGYIPRLKLYFPAIPTIFRKSFNELKTSKKTKQLKLLSGLLTTTKSVLQRGTCLSGLGK